MNRAALEHIIRAASGITNQSDMIRVEVVIERPEGLPFSSERLATIRERLHQLKRHL